MNALNLLIIAATFAFTSCSVGVTSSLQHYLHQTNASEADIGNKLFYAVESHPRVKAIMARQPTQLAREQSVFFGVIKDKSIWAEIGREWPDAKPGWVDTRLTDQELKEIGEVVHDVVKTRKLKGILTFAAVKKNRTVRIYQRKL
jgi:hypothetical protein